LVKSGSTRRRPPSWRKCPDVFDAAASRAVIEIRREVTNGTLLGFLFGAEVFESSEIFNDHVMLFPSGWEVKILDGSGCTPL